MIISNVNIGSGPGANDGESIYSAFYKVNQNFANVQSNINSLTNSVSSVAGRTGNVTLTINDIVGLNTSYALNGNVTAANIGMKGYVDAKIAANVAALVDSAPAVLDTLNELAAALNDDASFSTTILNTITLANTIQSGQIVSANLGMKGYVDSVAGGSYSNVNTLAYLTTNSYATQAYVNTANLGMKGYVDSVASQSIYGNANVASYLPSYSGNLNAKYATFTGDNGAGASGLGALTVGIPGIETFGNTIAQFHTNINNPAGITVHNNSSGPEAVSGYVATADIGDENVFRTLLGITSSGYNTATSASSQLKPLDSLLWAIGGNLVIGTLAFSGVSGVPVKDIVFTISNGSTQEVLRMHASDDSSSANLELGANVGILFNDGSRQASAYSNVQTAAFTNLSTYAYNANVTAANLGMKGYVDSVASQSIYGNSNVKSYLTQFDGNIVPSANVTYSLGSITNQWKDLFVSNNTIFIGGVPLSIDAGGNLLVNGNVVQDATSNITLPANGIITAPINQEFQLQAKDGNSVLRNEINLDPNNGTYMSVWSDETTSFSSADWGSGSWNNEEGLGAARFTDAQALQDFWTTGIGSLGLPIEASINGGPRTPNVFYENNNGETYGVYLGLDAVPPGGQGTTVPITSLVFYYRTQSKINMDVDGGEILLDAQGLDIDLRTTLNLDLRANQNLNLRGLGQYPVRIYTDDTTHKWEFDNTGSLTLPREGKIYGVGDGVAAGDRLGYISWTGNSSGDGSGYNTMRLVPDLTGLEAADQYIIIDPTSGEPGHIHIRAGGTQDNSLAHLFLGGENSHVKISAGANPPVTVLANNNAWTFGTDGNITFPDSTVQTTAWTGSSYSNVQVATYLPTYTGNISAGNVSVEGTSGKIGFSSGGFAQQATSNSTQVTSHFTSGNIQLMSIDLGANAAHTVPFSCNKLTTNDILVVKHVSGGLTSVYVDAYVQSDGLAIIWMRDITGVGTGAFTPMLKYAIIQAPSS